MRRALPLLLSLSACGPKMVRFPGPLGSVGQDPPSVLIQREVDEPSSEVAQIAHPPKRPPSSPTGEAIAKAAEHYLDHTPRGFRDDCSGYVMASLARAGVPAQGSTRSFWEEAKDNGLVHKRKLPLVGDLVFFDNTYDRNRNGRWDDPLTHIAVVLEVQEDGTIVMGHGGTSRGRTTLRMNLRHPSERRDESGHVLNDYLRSRRSSDPASWEYLAGELWRGFATVSETSLAQR